MRVTLLISLLGLAVCAIAQTPPGPPPSGSPPNGPPPSGPHPSGSPPADKPELPPPNQKDGPPDQKDGKKCDKSTPNPPPRVRRSDIGQYGGQKTGDLVNKERPIPTGGTLVGQPKKDEKPRPRARRDHNAQADASANQQQNGHGKQPALSLIDQVSRFVNEENLQHPEVFPPENPENNQEEPAHNDRKKRQSFAASHQELDVETESEHDISDSSSSEEENRANNQQKEKPADAPNTRVKRQEPFNGHQHHVPNDQSSEPDEDTNEQLPYDPINPVKSRARRHAKHEKKPKEEEDEDNDWKAELNKVDPEDDEDHGNNEPDEELPTNNDHESGNLSSEDSSEQEEEDFKEGEFVDVKSL